MIAYSVRNKTGFYNDYLHEREGAHLHLKEKEHTNAMVWNKNICRLREK